MRALNPINLPRLGDQILDAELDDISEISVMQAEEVIATMGDVVKLFDIRRVCWSRQVSIGATPTCQTAVMMRWQTLRWTSYRVVHFTGHIEIWLITDYYLIPLTVPEKHI